MPYPRITVVTPSFNQASYLPETIDSVLKQDYPNIEYIIIDGGSTDGSAEIIKRHERHLAYWVSEKDRGQSHAIMKGFQKGTGELFAWVNSDDVLLPGCLETVANCYLQRSRPDIIHTNVVYIDSESKVFRCIRTRRQSRFFFFRGVWCGYAPSVFFKSSLFDAVGGLREDYRLSMDLDIWMRMMQEGARVAHIGRYLGAFRWHDQAKTVCSLQKRTTVENSETMQILAKALPASSPARRTFWRRIFKCYKLLTLDHFRARLDFRRIQSMQRENGTGLFSLAGVAR
jgi:glycosyltransferase involved in cell wall biosynthesis